MAEREEDYKRKERRREGGGKQMDIKIYFV